MQFDSRPKFRRRDVLKAAGVAAVGGLPGNAASGQRPAHGKVPGYLQRYAKQYVEDPRAAARAWFADAKYGLFMHYGLYSQLARGEWVMLRETVVLQ
jgi:alpha-L-fucosidase